MSPAHAKSFGPSANTGTIDPSLTRARDQLPGSSAPPGAAPGAPGNPDPGRQLGVGAKNRQKMLENRQRQLASLQKMEERIRTTSSSASNPRPPSTSSTVSSCPHHRLTSHLLDISQAVDGHWVEWLTLPHTSLPNAPQVNCNPVITYPFVHPFLLPGEHSVYLGFGPNRAYHVWWTSERCQSRIVQAATYSRDCFQLSSLPEPSPNNHILDLKVWLNLVRNLVQF